MAKDKFIEADKEYYEELKEKYQQANEAGDESFTIQGDEIHTGYAKYVIEYLEMERPEWKDD